MVRITIAGGGVRETEQTLVKNILAELGFKDTTALVMKDGELLTPDRHVKHGDDIQVVPVVSGG